ncbi:hypothetical protein ACLOJK_023349 [Asimina triloba]
MAAALYRRIKYFISVTPALTLLVLNGWKQPLAAQDGLFVLLLQGFRLVSTPTHLEKPKEEASLFLCHIFNSASLPLDLQPLSCHITNLG